MAGFGMIASTGQTDVLVLAGIVMALVIVVIVAYSVLGRFLLVTTRWPRGLHSSTRAVVRACTSPETEMMVRNVLPSHTILMDTLAVSVI